MLARTCSIFKHHDSDESYWSVLHGTPFLFFTPAVVYLLPKTMIELAQCYEKNTTKDYVLLFIFNVFYIMNLGLAYDEEYQGPVYSKKSLASNSNLHIA